MLGSGATKINKIFPSISKSQFTEFTEYQTRKDCTFPF